MGSRIYFLIVFLSLIISSCDKEDAPGLFRKAGALIDVKRTLTQEFYKIDLNDDINLKLIRDTIEYIELSGPKNLLPEIITIINDQTLYIKNNNKVNWVRKLSQEFTAIVHLKRKSTLNIICRGYGKVNTEGTLNDSLLSVDCWGTSSSLNFNVDCRETSMKIHTGPADITLTGKTGLSYLYSIGNGFVYASSLKTPFTFLTNSGTGNMHVYATEWLAVTMQNTGDVYYSGNPLRVDKNISDSGTLIKAD